MPWSVFDDIWNLDPLRWSLATPEYRRGRTRPFPAVNVYGNDEKLVVTSEIPGLKIDDLDISIHGRNLTLGGKRTMPEAGENECYTCTERTHGDFSRTITLPFGVEADKVKAHYERGLLTLHLPRVESDKPRKIAVKAA